MSRGSSTQSSRTQQWKLKPYPAPGHFLMLGTLMPSATKEEAVLSTMPYSSLNLVT
jgi:hypothetical protein